MSNGTDRYGRDYDDPEYGNYGIEPGRGGSTSIRPNRIQKFGQALEAAANYKKKRAAENEADAAIGKKDNDDEKNTQGFKISPDTTVVEGYMNKPFTLAGVKGSSPLGPIGAAVGIFNPALGAGISSVGNYISS